MLKGKESIECTNTLSNIALVYRKQNKFKEALENYNRELSINELVKGKESMHCSFSLYNIGHVYYYQGKLN